MKKRVPTSHACNDTQEYQGQHTASRGANASAFVNQSLTLNNMTTLTELVFLARLRPALALAGHLISASCHTSRDHMYLLIVKSSRVLLDSELAQHRLSNMKHMAASVGD